MTYNTSNGVKPRYDGGGTEFGLMHRDLGPGYLMFDIDRLSATIEVNLELRRENEGFVEYRHVDGDVSFIAMFEVKAKKTATSSEALNYKNSNSMARLALAKKIEARLFVVFGTNGGQPFTFYEIDTTTGESKIKGVLKYNRDNREEQCRNFWAATLGIRRYSFNRYKQQE